MKKKTAILALIASLIASPAFAVQATLNWTNPNPDASTGARIERGSGADPVSFTSQGTVGANVTVFNQTGLALGTRYCYRVIKFSAMGDAPQPWPTACGTPDAPLNVNGLTIIFAP